MLRRCLRNKNTTQFVLFTFSFVFVSLNIHVLSANKSQSSWGNVEKMYCSDDMVEKIKIFEGKKWMKIISFYRKE
jgi:hypothetical protein